MDPDIPLFSGSHEPLRLFPGELFHPASRQLQVVVRPVRLVVQVDASQGLFGHRPLDLRALVPLVERRDGHHLGPDVQRRLQGRLIVAAVDPVARVVVVPRPDAGVYVAGAHAGDEEEVVALAEGLEHLPVLVRSAVGEAVRREVGVHAVEAACQDVMHVALLHHQCDEDRVVGRAAHAVGAARAQELGPRLRRGQVGVVDIEQWEALPRAGGELVKGSVVAIPAKTPMSDIFFLKNAISNLSAMSDVTYHLRLYTTRPKKVFSSVMVLSKITHNMSTYASKTSS